MEKTGQSQKSKKTNRRPRIAMPKKQIIIAGTENRASFFNRIRSLYPTMDPRYEAIEKAYNQAEEAFQKIKRRSGEKYFEHLRAVSLIIIDYLRIRSHEIIIAGLLHDIVEDIPQWSIEKVKREYGYRVALLVEWLTKPDKAEFGGSKEKRDSFYYKKLDQAPRDFWLIKLPDRWHNLLTLWEPDKEIKRRKIEETRRFFLSAAEREIILIHELEAAITAIEKTM